MKYEPYLNLIYWTNQLVKRTTIIILTKTDWNNLEVIVLNVLEFGSLSDLGKYFFLWPYNFDNNKNFCS